MPSPESYNRVRQRAQARSAALVATGQEIGPLPPVRDHRPLAARTAPSGHGQDLSMPPAYLNGQMEVRAGE